MVLGVFNFQYFVSGLSDAFQTGALNEAWEKADKDYMRFVKIARIALKSEHALYRKLALSGARKKLSPAG